MATYSDADLAAFLDEALSADRSKELEEALRADESLRQRLIEVRGREAAGLHTIGAIWRRARLSCPQRDELGKYVMGTLSEEASDYIDFHLQQIGCRYCAANLDDLRSATQVDKPVTQRRERYFQTSAGYLRKPS